MAAVDPVQLTLQIAVAYACCIFFFGAGTLLCAFFNVTDSDAPAIDDRLFYGLLAGMILTITLYSIAVSGFKTINIVIPLAAVVCFRRKKHPVLRAAFSALNKWRLLELLLITTVFTLIFNFLPESEYKQRDSFFYLKITEALNFTGQENANNYYNLLSAQFHGVEAYHYFECWLSAFLLKFTDTLLPNIQTFRIVTYTVVSTIFLYGTFYLYRLVAGRGAGSGIKLFCLSFVFFMPDIIGHFPNAISRYFIYSFESNFLERPNFRLIYLFLLPVLGGAIKTRFDRRFIFFLICLCLVNPTVLAVVLPAFIVLIICQYAFPRFSNGSLLSKNEMWIFAGFGVCYWLFYYLLPVENVPPVYDLQISDVIHQFKTTWKLSALTFTTSLLYIILFIGLVSAICYKWFAGDYHPFVHERRIFLLLTALLILTGIFVGRIFPSVENIYQVAYNSYIVASLFILTLFMLMAKTSWKVQVLLVVVCLASYVVNRIHEGSRGFVFTQNDKHVYSGIEYSSDYINQVTAFASGREMCMGAFIADSSFYAGLYYSLRNPNVYHLPVTYILANHATVNDFCLSDPRAIKYDRAGNLQHNQYLDNAIARSIYHRSYSSYAVSDTATLSNIGDFIRKNHLQYLVLTSGVPIDSIPGIKVTQKFTDPNTKERFWVIE
jgi:hypothetical protein